MTDTAPSTHANVRVRMWLEAYDQPEAETAGQVNQTTPPAMNTTQYWTSQSYNVNSGQQSIGLTRVGNYIRNLVFVYRDADGTRGSASGGWPDDAVLYLDTRAMDHVPEAAWKTQIYERYRYQSDEHDTNVWPYDFCHEFDGQVGHENRDLWLPTLGSTRLELRGNFGSNGTLYVLTNDVTTAGPVFL